MSGDISATDWGQWMPDTQTNDQQKDCQNIDNNFESCLTTINDLTEYELIKIFNYFPIKERFAFRSVCSQWRLCVDKTFKSELILSANTIDPRSVYSPELFCSLINKFPNIRHISLSGINIFNDDEEEMKTIITTIVSNCSQLQSIDLGTFSLTEEMVTTHIDYFLRLKKIFSSNITENALNLIIGSEQLLTLDINRNDKISLPQLKRLGPKIRELNLNQSNVIQLESIRDLCEGNGKQLEILSIDINDKEVLSTICDNLKKLIEFNMCLNSENCDFKRFAKFIDLKTLRIEVNNSFKSDDFIDLIRALKFTKISELSIILTPMNNIAVTDESLEELRQNCPLIESLVLRGANSLTGSGMYSIAQLTQLKHLDLKNCLHISDQIDIVITSCPLLRRLNLHNCSHISKATVEPFFEKAKTSPNQEFFIDVIETNVSAESLPLEEKPKNLKILYESEDCMYSDCDHGWTGDGYHSGSECGFNEMMDDLDFYMDDDGDDYYDEYGDEEYDYNFS